MGNLHDTGIHFFFARGICYGLFIRIRGRAYVAGATKRGLFYRFGMPIVARRLGYWDTFFGLRTGVGAVNLFLCKWLKYGEVTCRFRPSGVRGHITFYRSGVLHFIGGSCSPSTAQDAWYVVKSNDFEMEE